MESRQKPTMAVVRGVSPRMSEIYFYSQFKSIKVRFIGDKSTGWVLEKNIPSNIEFIDLPLKPRWLIDPVSIFLGRRQIHRSWQDVAGLESYLEDVDIVNISDMFYFYSGQAALLARKMDKSLVTVVWESVPHHPSTYIPPYSFNVRMAKEYTDLFIARSRMAASYLTSLGIAEDRIKLVYKGVDTNCFRPAVKTTDHAIRILYAGQLVKSKGINEMLKAFIKLSAEFTDVQLWIAARSLGDPLEKRVKDLSSIYPIRWLGHVSYDKLPKLYRQCDIYCQLSQDWYYLGLLKGGNEWFSYSIIEAMASGLPVVATNVGGMPEQLGADNLTVLQKDVDSVYLALKKLVTDEIMRKQIGNANVKRARELFDIKKQASATENVILDMLGSGKLNRFR